MDLRTAQRVVLDRGSLALAMRATMSLPGIFPPVESEGRVLVDGGALDNVPADVVREMGAAVVIAVDVGQAATGNVDYSMFALMGQTVDSMMRANTRRALEAADLTIAVDVEGFGSLDWRRSEVLMERGYEAAERHREALLKYAVSDPEWQAWLAAAQRAAPARYPRAAIDRHRRHRAVRCRLRPADPCPSRGPAVRRERRRTGPCDAVGSRPLPGRRLGDHRPAR